MGTSGLFCAFAAATIVGTAIVSTHADTPIVIVVTNGTPVPEGNGTISFGLSSSGTAVVINDAGQVTFRANVAVTNNSDLISGIYRADVIPGNLVNIAREGQPAPDGNGSFGNLNGDVLVAPSLNSTGQVAFYSPLTGTTNGAAQGIFRWSSGVLTQIVRTGWTVPDGNGVYSSLTTVPALNNGGQVAFESSLTGTVGGANDDAGEFRGNGATLTQIARGPINNLSTPSINDSGRAAFFYCCSALASNQGEYLGDDATLAKYAYGNEPAPDGNGLLLGTWSVPALNNSGQLGFSANVIAASLQNFRIFRGDGDMLTQIVRNGQTVPGGNGTFGQSGTAGTQFEFMNSSGQIVFDTLISGTMGGTNQIGIYRGDGVTLTKIARQGEPAPDSNNATFALLNPSANPTDVVAINDSGQVAFLASLSGTSQQGIYFYDNQLGLIKVIRTGDTLLGRTVTNLRFYAYSWLGRQGTGLNNKGQVAFSYVLDNSVPGIAVWNAPEFRITDIRIVTNDVRLTWNTIAGKTNVVQVAPGGNYSTNSFTDLSSNIVVAGVGQTSTNYLDVGGATNRAARYYRVRLVP